MHSNTIAKYIRLSIDEAVTESLSIPNQRLILDNHIEELDIPNSEIVEFIDNDYSGTNMERPAVQELIEYVRSGKISIIVVKDFSRFSRNALESGYYIEQVFPLYGIRFISVSDHFDSYDYKNNTGGIDIAFKFLMHEYYSKDLSAKVKSAYRIKMKRGENIVANAIYGYYKAETGKWEPDEPAADVVRQIFQMALEGLPTARIRDNLSSFRHPTPQEYKDIKRGKNVEPKCMWTARMVLGILENEQYMGSYVSGKQEHREVGTRSTIQVDKSGWIIFPNSHTSIVSSETFYKAQAIIETRKHNVTIKPATNVWKENVTCSKRKRMIDGNMKFAVAPYGYKLDNDFKLKIDTEAANVVRGIFELFVEGLSVAEISQRLFEAKYPTPRTYYLFSCGKSVEPSFEWRNKKIRDILKNEAYTGAYVAGKSVKDHETGKKYRTHKSEWIVIPDKHPAIISKEMFTETQEILNSVSRKKANNRNVKTPKEHLLHGNIVKCGCCGYALSYDNTRTKDNSVYYCHHSLPDPGAKCYRMKVNAKELQVAVMEIIKKQAEVLLGSSRFTDLRKVNNSAPRLADYELQYVQLAQQLQIYYEQFATEEISQEEYFSLKSDLSDKAESLFQQIEICKQQEQTQRAAKKTANVVNRVMSEETTEREIVELLIDKIHVFPNHHIEIRWKIADFTLVAAESVA